MMEFFCIGAVLIALSFIAVVAYAYHLGHLADQVAEEMYPTGHTAEDLDR